MNDEEADLYSRYVTKLSRQEDEIEDLRKKIDQLQTQISEKRNSLKQYIADLEMD